MNFRKGKKKARGGKRGGCERGTIIKGITEETRILHELGRKIWVYGLRSCTGVSEPRHLDTRRGYTGDSPRTVTMKERRRVR